MIRRRSVSFILSIALALAGCSADRSARLSGENRVDRVQDLLVRGVAHAEIEEWPQAIELFQEAASLASEEPVVAFDLAVVYLRSGDLLAAEDWLNQVDVGAPVTLRARVEYVRGKLALERGDAEAEAQAYRRAAELDPTEPAFPYALSQVVPRLGGDDVDAEVGELLARAFELWAQNARVASELAQWSLGQPVRGIRSRGVDLVVELAAGQAEIEALVTRGLDEFAEDPDRSPVSLRRALNLLRPGKRFQADSAMLESRLATLPLAEPVDSGLRRRGTPKPALVSLEVADLLPEMPLAAGERVVQVVASNDAVVDETAGLREADLVILTDRGLWFLDRHEEEYRRLASFQNEPRELLVGELDGDGWMEIVVTGAGGVSLWGRAAEGDWAERDLDRELAAAEAFSTFRFVDFEHDGDLDLLAIDREGQLVLVTHRGEAGLGAPRPAPLAAEGKLRLVRSVDIDNDIDQDLLLVTDTTIEILVNLRQGEYVPGKRLPISAGLEDLMAVDYTGDGRFDLVGLSQGQLVFWRNSEILGFEPDEEVAAQVSGLMSGPAGGSEGDERVSVFAASDLDLDGDPDLVTVSATGALVLVNESGRFEAGPAIAGTPADVGGLSSLDLDGDLDPDLLAWGGTSLWTAVSTGAEGQGWLRIRLRGLMGKVPLDGRGARVDLRFGLDSYSREAHRPELVVGLGGREPSLVKVTWPNGISEYLFDPEPDAGYVIEQELRIEGSCPFLYASDGSRMRFVTDILGLAPLGMLASEGRYVPPDPEEYLRLPDWVTSEETVELRITEELREVAFIDQTELVVVDAPEAVEVYNGERWIEGPIEGLDLRLLGPFQVPTAVTSDAGQHVLDVVSRLDERYLTNHTGGRMYQGAVAPHRLEIEIPVLVAETGRSALVLTGWLHWGNTSMNVARAQDPAGKPKFPTLEVPSADGGWAQVDRQVGLPAGKTKPVVVDLSGIVDPADPRVRITTDFEVYWDQIAVTESLPANATTHRIHRLAPSEAELSYGGFSRWYRTVDNGPYLFDFGDRRPYPWRENSSGARPIAWQEHEGFYTRFGPVDHLVSDLDDRLVVFGAGEELALSFDVSELPPLPVGWRRTLFLHSEGWEKDGDPNVACGQTVGPLPSRGVAGYPCQQIAGVESSDVLGDTVSSPDRSRWVGRDRLERRVTAWAKSGNR